MIVEVRIEDDEPRRYRVERQGFSFRVRRVDNAGAEGDGAPGTLPAASALTANGDEPLVIDWRRPEDGLYSLLVGHRSYEVFVDDEGDELAVHLLNRTFRVWAVDARRRRVMASSELVDGVVRITAPIPGRVTRVLAPPGSDVRQGDGVVVVEAMKMENELRAPRDGTVASIEVEEGQGVDGGALLAVIE